MLVVRYRAEGEATFEPGSRRPKTSPNAIRPETADLTARLRKELSGQGLDADPGQYLLASASCSVRSRSWTDGDSMQQDHACSGISPKTLPTRCSAHVTPAPGIPGWPSSRLQGSGRISQVVDALLPAGNMLEIARGTGRWTSALLAAGGRVRPPRSAMGARIRLISE